MYHTNNLLKRMQTARAIVYLVYDPGKKRNLSYIYNHFIEPLGISYNVFCGYLREPYDAVLAAAEPLSYHVLLGLWTSVQAFVRDKDERKNEREKTPSPDQIEQDLYRGRMLFETARNERSEAWKRCKRSLLPAPAL